MRKTIENEMVYADIETTLLVAALFHRRYMTEARYKDIMNGSLHFKFFAQAHGGHVLWTCSVGFGLQKIGRVWNCGRSHQGTESPEWCVRANFEQAETKDWKATRLR